MSVYVALMIKDDETKVDKILEQCQKFGISPHIFDARVFKHDPIKGAEENKPGEEISELEIIKRFVYDAKANYFEKIWILNGDSEILANPCDMDLSSDLSVFDYSVLEKDELICNEAFGIERDIELSPSCADSWILDKTGVNYFNKIYTVEKLYTVMQFLKDLEECQVLTDMVINALYLRECKKIKFYNDNIILFETKNTILNKKWEPLRLNSYTWTIPETVKYMQTIFSDFERNHVLNVQLQAELLIKYLLLKISEYEDKDAYFKALCGLVSKSVMSDTILYSNFEDSFKIGMLKMLDVEYGQK